MGGSKSTTTQATSEPWKAAQPYLKGALGEASKVYNSGVGFSPYGGSTVTPYSNQSLQAFQGIEGLANQGNPLAGQAYSNAQNVISGGGITPEGRTALQSTFDTATGGNQIGNQGWMDFMSGADDMLGATARGDYVTGGSPQFNAALNYQSGQLADDINRGFSNAGRYGSGAHANALGEQVGQFRNNALASEIQREQALQAGAQNSLLGARQNAQGALTGIEGANISNMVSAGNSFADQLRAGQGLAGSYSGMIGDLYGQQFAPYQQLANVGSMYEDLATRTTQDQIDKWNALQQEPWQRLASYSALLNGAGQLGSTNTQTAQGPSTLQNVAGGALGGMATGAGMGSLFGLPGAALGGILGGIGGFF